MNEKASTMDNEIVRRILIDPNLSSYEKFFDHNWSKDVFAAVKGSQLEGAADRLVFSWRSANGAHILPWLTIKLLTRLTLGLNDGNQLSSASYAGQFVREVVNKLEGKMDCHLNVDQRLALGRAIKTIEHDAREAVKSAGKKDQSEEMDRYWHFLLQQSEFQFCILGIQSITYSSLYFAYEDFLQNVVRTREPTYDSKSKSLGRALSEIFDKSFCDSCWEGEVELARLVRNALVHNGGTFGGKLDTFQPRFVNASDTETPPIQGAIFILVDNTIQITPDNTTYLFGVLKDRVLRIVEHAARLSSRPDS